MRLPEKSVLEAIYGESEQSLKRYEALAMQFNNNFNSQEMEFFSAPGRTEIIGNHTDHNGGKVIAASINMDTIGAAALNHSEIISIISESCSEVITVDLCSFDTIPENQGTLSLVAGMMKAVKEFGFHVSGFHAYISTNVIPAAGVSSSASFEMLLCTIINYFFNENQMNCIDYAMIGQYAENHYWNKASGLMDQMACAVGGTISLDFNGQVKYEKADFTFKQIGYDFVIINTGKGHADLSQEYSEIPSEMKLTASCLGTSQLSESSLSSLLEQCTEIGQKADNDRAILRSMHFYEENRRVEEGVRAIKANQKSLLINLIRESGNSSWKWLQNCYANDNYKDQKVTLTLALAELFLHKIGDGCCRVHGGGFAGVIACVVPIAETKNFIGYMSQFVTKENIYPMQIRETGAAHL